LRPYFEKKKSQNRAGGVAQGVDPFQAPAPQKKKKKKKPPALYGDLISQVYLSSTQNFLDGRDQPETYGCQSLSLRLKQAFHM
jgi:hypothetical protein